MKDTTAQQDDETSLSSAKYQNETDSDGNGDYENPKKKMRSAGEKKRDKQNLPTDQEQHVMLWKTWDSYPKD